jgi:ADP-heptose:LPS heptosyltransferase
MIIISPFAKKLTNGKENPKNFPYWKELIAMIDEPVVQVGIAGETQLCTDFRQNLPLDDLKKLLKECRTWISCDSFFQHLAWSEGKPGTVIWSISDPLIFGHPENINLLKDRSYLASNQFLWWEAYEFDANRFFTAEQVFQALP